jgi:hypothetical protein
MLRSIGVSALRACVLAVCFGVASEACFWRGHDAYDDRGDHHDRDHHDDHDDHRGDRR